MPEDEERLYTKGEVETIAEIAVIKASHSSMKDEFAAHEHREQKWLEDLSKSVTECVTAVREIPMEMTKCRDGLDGEVRKWVADNFVAKPSLTLHQEKMEHSMTALKTDMDNKFNSLLNRITYTVGGFTTCALVVVWLMSKFNLWP